MCLVISGPKTASAAIHAKKEVVTMRYTSKAALAHFGVGKLTELKPNEVMLAATLDADIGLLASIPGCGVV